MKFLNCDSNHYTKILETTLLMEQYLNLKLAQYHLILLLLEGSTELVYGIFGIQNLTWLELYVGTLVDLVHWS